MSGLNAPQQAAEAYVDGPLLVLAGAGSGKTKVITEKIAHLIHSKAFPPEQIAAITFTNKAAREMRERVGKRISKTAAEAVTVTTFHSLGLQFLQSEAKLVGLRRGFPFSIPTTSRAFSRNCYRQAPTRMRCTPRTTGFRK